MLYIAINMFVSAVFAWCMWQFVKLFKQAIKEFHLDSSAILDTLCDINLKVSSHQGEIDMLKHEMMMRLNAISLTEKKHTKETKKKDPKQSERMKQVWAERRAKKEQEKNSELV